MSPIKVLIIGEYGFMMNHLIDRFHREKCDIYTIAGARAKEKADKLPAHTIFEFSPDSAAMKYIMQCIKPDTIIFMGAQNDSYDWNNDMTFTQYTAELNNVLIWAKTNMVRRFIYLSTMEIYEGDYNMPIAEDTEPVVKDFKNLTIYNGESLCKLYNDNTMEVHVLRFPIVYGPSHFVYEKFNPIEKKFFDAKRKGKISVSELSSYMTIYVSDAVDAVYKIMTKKKCKQYIYHVNGEKVTTDKEISDIIKKNFDIPSQIVGKNAKKRNVYLNGEQFEKEFNYSPHIDLISGIKRTGSFVEENYEQLIEKYQAEEEGIKKAKREKEKDNLRLIWSQIKRTVENIVLFVVMLLLTSQFGSMSMFANIDIMLFYVLLSALSFGVGQSIFSVILATAGNIYIKMSETDMGISTVLSQYSIIFQFLFYFIFAIMISYTILRNKQSVKEKQEQLEDLQDEYELIYDVNKTNVEIKKVFEDRLLNYGDSIGKIYNIVSELDLLDPEKIAVASLDVVRKIMNVRDVCIYRAARDGYYHFVDATTEDAKVMKRAIRLNDYPEMKSVMETGDVFVNHKIGNQLPRMAAPIYADNRLIYIIMLWNIEFEQLNTYQKNLFLVLAKIITSSLKKGYQYEEVGRLQNYYENTDVLFPHIFNPMVLEKMENVPYDQAEYSIIQIDMEGQSMEDMSDRLRMLVRDDDKIGKIEDDDPHLYILVHAGYSEVSFVVEKLNKNGIKCKAVKD